MKTCFSEYRDAFAKAQELANMHQREMGIEKRREFGATIFAVRFLPKPEFRSGSELQCEIVYPYEPTRTSDDLLEM